MSYARTEHAILEARKVVASKGAEELRRASGGRRGSWTREDEEALRAGYLKIWNERTSRFERFDLPGDR